MKKIGFLLLLVLSLTYASTLNKVGSYKEAQERAILENKHIMVLITTKRCQYCKKMKKRTFSIPKVIDRINKSYIFVEVTRFEDDYPKNLKAMGVPTTYFLYNDGTPILRGVLGYWNSVDFLSFMDDADRKIAKRQ